MGRFVNARTSAFQDVLNSEIYVDKTGLLEYTNRVMDTTAKFICNSRPRRFGKSITADRIAAYYCKACDPENVVSYITENTISELREYYPEELKGNTRSLPEALSKINAATGKKCIVVIDEWDVLVRDEALNQSVQKEYISF